MKTAVVILNWNGKKLLEQFLPSVVSFTPLSVDIIVADNNSSDDSIAFITASYPQIKIIRNSINGGFAKGYNDSLKFVDADVFVLLNSDVEVTSNWIEPIINLMEADASIAACQPKLLWHRQKDSFEYAGASGGFIDRFGYPFCRGRLLDKLEQDTGQYNDAIEVFWATGACMFIRSEAFRAAGGFDEDFFAHMEEIDLCWRLKNKGYKIFVEPASVVYHVGAATLNKVSPNKTYLNFRNSFYALIKNLPRRYFIRTLLIRAFFDYLAIADFLFTGKFPHALAVLKAHKDIIANWNGLVKKRNSFKTINQDDLSCVFRGSIIVEYYLRKKKVIKF